MTGVQLQRLGAALKGYVRLGRVTPTALNTWRPPVQVRTARSSSVMPQVLALVSLRQWFKVADLMRLFDGMTNQELSA